MAIMWDPPVERPALEPTPAELAWKHWLMEAIVSKNQVVRQPEESSGKPAGPPETLTPAA